MKLRVLIKEALVRSLSLTHVSHYTVLFTYERASSIFLIKETTQESLYVFIYIKVLETGLGFSPTPSFINEADLQKKFDEFARKMRFKW